MPLPWCWTWLCRNDWHRYRWSSLNRCTVSNLSINRELCNPHWNPRSNAFVSIPIVCGIMWLKHLCRILSCSWSSSIRLSQRLCLARKGLSVIILTTSPSPSPHYHPHPYPLFCSNVISLNTGLQVTTLAFRLTEDETEIRSILNAPLIQCLTRTLSNPKSALFEMAQKTLHVLAQSKSDEVTLGDGTVLWFWR